MNLTIQAAEIKDIRFPTSQYLHGSDAMNPDPDYSAAYVILKTNQPGMEGHGFTFTIGRGNEICTVAIQAMLPLVIGKDLSVITKDMAGFWRHISGDSQLRWLGPEKGVIHLAMGAIVNAVWDLWAKAEGKPLWQLVADMDAETLVSCIDFTYITDVITPKEAIALIKAKEATRSERIANLKLNGYPAYTTSAGWLGYSEEKIRSLCKSAIEDGWTHIKMKVGANLDDDMRRASIIRDVIGYDTRLMMDANQKWDVNVAIERMSKLAVFKPYWIEEPTSPDDILGHAAIAKAVAPIKVATGEHCHNRVMFKQLLQAGALQICQIDSCRVGGVNEILAILLMAAKFNVPVCPHAGGVGLCELVQHLAMIDFICISGTLENRIIEYVDHLHEHFVDPVRIRRGAYLPPTMAGYSCEMKKESLSEYSFPAGKVWRELKSKKGSRVMRAAFDLAGKQAVITGGASGIGKAITLLFAKAGARVVVLEMNADNGRDVIKLVEEEGGSGTFIQCNVANHNEVRSVVDSIPSRIDILVNNAGIAHVGTLQTTSEADFDNVFRVNVKGVYNCMQAVLDRMLSNAGGVILNMASVASMVGIPDRFAYSMTKGAVLTMTYSVARDFVSKNIRCNCISPARIHTPFVDGFIQKNYAGKEREMMEALSKSQPIGRMGTPEEVADLALYLCSDSASFITGTNFPIDGGFVKLHM